MDSHTASNNPPEVYCVRIDVAKDKHDCFVMNSERKVLCGIFTIANNADSFGELFFKIKSISRDLSKVKVGLEATGHYHSNLLGFLKNIGLGTILINPLYTSQRRKSISLRKTKADKVDAHTVAGMILSEVSLNPYLYYNEDLKSLTRYHFDKVSERCQLKQSVTRLVHILFPELKSFVSTLHGKAVYALLSELSDAHQIVSTNLKHLTKLLKTASKGHFSRASADEIREAARRLIGTYSTAKSLELRHTIHMIQELFVQIKEIET